MLEPILLDERLSVLANAVTHALEGIKDPCAADIGCDHGYLTAALLERIPSLTMIASDVSAPSLGKAERLITARGLSKRVSLHVADGLSALPDEGVQAIVIAGMGAGTILKIVSRGEKKIGNAALIVQANVDWAMLRTELARLGYRIDKEIFCEAAGRHYVTMVARRAETQLPDARRALLGTAYDGISDEAQRRALQWMRSVRIKELQKIARFDAQRVKERAAQIGCELDWLSEVLGMHVCTVSDVEKLVGQIAPYELAMDWDNVGLLLGKGGAPVTRALVALDLTRESVEEAKALGAQLVITHHPIMFSARKRITDADREGALILDMAAFGMAHIAAHTNLDDAPGGVNETLMALMGAQDVTGSQCVRVGKLADGMTLGDLAVRAQDKLRGPVRVYGKPDTPVYMLGCCSGAGGSEVEAAKALGADCFITGEIRHHEALEAMHMGVCVLEAGHFETENPICEVLTAALQNAADAVQYKVTFFCSKGNPFGR